MSPCYILLFLFCEITPRQPPADNLHVKPLIFIPRQTRLDPLVYCLSCDAEKIRKLELIECIEADSYSCLLSVMRFNPLQGNFKMISAGRSLWQPAVSGPSINAANRPSYEPRKLRFANCKFAPSSLFHPTFKNPLLIWVSKLEKNFFKNT